MPAFEIAEVAVEGTAYTFDRPYSYLVPEKLSGKIMPGERVTVPFGGANRHRRGIVIDVAVKEKDSGCKPIAEAVDSEPLINAELVGLALFLKEHTFCTLFEALRLMLPAGLNLRIAKTYRLDHELTDAELLMLSHEEQCMVERLRRAKEPLEREALAKAAGVDKDTPIPDLLVRRGVLLCEDTSFESSGEASQQMVRLAKSDEETEAMLHREGFLTKKQKSALEIIFEAGAASVKEVSYYSGVTHAVIAALVKKGAAEFFEQRIFRDPYKNINKNHIEEDILSPAQQNSYDELAARYRSGSASASLLYGVTGSGKTQVFMRLIDDVIKEKKSAIVLVPEISLTPQAVARFISRFGKDVAVLHSGLSLGERLDEWQRIKNGDAHIVVGTRSAVFAPLENLGIIIIDEEQEYTYKSESSPRYHARDVARYRCAKSGAMMLLASATPSVDSFFAAKTGRYSLTRLDERYGEAQLPEVITVDMKKELAAGNTGPISERLAEEIDKNLKSGEQSILLINRRGYNTFVSCEQCGHVMTCPNCSIALTYHAANKRLMCHYCGYSTEMLSHCPECSGNFLRYAGTGTQKVEEELERLFPTARILRMDTDTTGGRYSHERMLEEFGRGDCDILIGTQMVAKGLDFPNVTLVGVLSADNSLYTNDFRAAERTFSLITQVCGRAGRSKTPGRAVIETQTPENNVLLLAAAQNYDAFYREEIDLRKVMLYPPFCDICEIGFVGIFESTVRDAALDFFNRLRAAVLNDKSVPVRIMTPSPAGVAKIAGRFRYKIIIKCKNNSRFRSIIKTMLEGCGKIPLYRKVTVFADMNPLDIM